MRAEKKNFIVNLLGYLFVFANIILFIFLHFRFFYKAFNQPSDSLVFIFACFYLFGIIVISLFGVIAFLITRGKDEN